MVQGSESNVKGGAGVECLDILGFHILDCYF